MNAQMNIYIIYVFIRDVENHQIKINDYLSVPLFTLRYVLFVNY